MEAMRILLVAGGWSTEREISLIGARAIERTLAALGHHVTLFDLKDGFEPLLELARSHDAAFLNLHGQPGEDGLVQALLDRAGCPYQGAGPAGSFLALNKAAAKALFRMAGIRTPRYVFLPRRPEDGWRSPIPFPLFVKSNTGGSSIDLFRVVDEGCLRKALDTLFAQRQEVLVEEMIPGREVTCGVLGRLGQERALPPVLIVPKREFFDYHDKYADNGADEICPAPLDGDTVSRVQAAALAAHRCLGLTGYSRADFRLRDDGELFILEVNTLPGMTSASLVPKEAAASGISFEGLLESLIEVAVAERGRRTQED